MDHLRHVLRWASELRDGLTQRRLEQRDDAYAELIEVIALGRKSNLARARTPCMSLRVSSTRQSLVLLCFSHTCVQMCASLREHQLLDDLVTLWGTGQSM